MLSQSRRPSLCTFQRSITRLRNRISLETFQRAVSNLPFKTVWQPTKKMPSVTVRTIPAQPAVRLAGPRPAWQRQRDVRICVSHCTNPVALHSRRWWAPLPELGRRPVAKDPQEKLPKKGWLSARVAVHQSCTSARSPKRIFISSLQRTHTHAHLVKPTLLLPITTRLLPACFRLASINVIAQLLTLVFRTASRPSHNHRARCRHSSRTSLRPMPTSWCMASAPPSSIPGTRTRARVGITIFSRRPALMSASKCPSMRCHNI